MVVREAMTPVRAVVGPALTLRAAAELMAEMRVGAALVEDADMPSHGILSERDILLAVAAGLDPDSEIVRDHMSTSVVFAEPGWPLRQAADAMLRSHFRHLIVVERGNVCGVISMRDVVRRWSRAGD